MQRVSGYSRAHVIRLIAQYREHGTLAVHERGVRTRFARRYTESPRKSWRLCYRPANTH